MRFKWVVFIISKTIVQRSKIIKEKQKSALTLERKNKFKIKIKFILISEIKSNKKSSYGTNKRNQRWRFWVHFVFFFLLKFHNSIDHIEGWVVAEDTETGKNDNICQNYFFLKEKTIGPTFTPKKPHGMSRKLWRSTSRCRWIKIISLIINI